MAIKKKAAKKRSTKKPQAPYDLDTDEGQAEAMAHMTMAAKAAGARSPHEAVRLLMNTAKQLSDVIGSDEFAEMIDALETVETHGDSITASNAN